MLVGKVSLPSAIVPISIHWYGTRSYRSPLVLQHESLPLAHTADYWYNGAPSTTRFHCVHEVYTVLSVPVQVVLMCFSAILIVVYKGHLEISGS